MSYEDFLQNLQTSYFSLYDKGLKKQANAALNEFMLKFDKISREQKDEILYKFCQELLDGENLKKFFARGNGEIPYFLLSRVKEFLTRECEKGQMPALRWGYEIIRDARLLELAYSHEKRDKKTIWLVFESFINDLYWWQHHFPDGCLTTKQDVEQHFQKCENFIKLHEISTEQRREFYYYKRLYELYWQWSEGEQEMEFADFCDENGLDFYEEAVYYYEK